MLIVFASGGMFRNANFDHIGIFASFIDEGNVFYALLS